MICAVCGAKRANGKPCTLRGNGTPAHSTLYVDHAPLSATPQADRLRVHPAVLQPCHAVQHRDYAPTPPTDHPLFIEGSPVVGCGAERQARSAATPCRGCRSPPALSPRRLDVVSCGSAAGTPGLPVSPCSPAGRVAALRHDLDVLRAERQHRRGTGGSDATVVCVESVSDGRGVSPRRLPLTPVPSPPAPPAASSARQNWVPSEEWLLANFRGAAVHAVQAPSTPTPYHSARSSDVATLCF